ncbi:sulfotransferase family 2 domain-containing protein [Halomonas binhaiensis]|uniref:Sulfotransferase family 2 domain-containing protein n=1 Tax=Halomonas binhaiensis TaxID=2562282 RepID=A0A5C1NIX7_9GAMM|nr:sulfotransferase family 2 domain-containing protein [Halomonas binhaiensis]QEM82593.1 sulfotransferase family 2 domain-containing protein [Halomonas binhaiensis]
MISHHHKAIFVHIPKCGGQSVEMTFMEDLGLDWDNRAPLLLRERVEGEKAPPRLAHLTADEYTENCYITPEMFSDYYKFTVVRDPYARLISTYNYLGVKEEVNAFISRLDSVFEEKKGRYWFMKPQADFLVSKDGKLAVDEVIKLEELSAKWAAIADKLRLKNTTLPHVNKSMVKKASVSDITPESREIVSRLFAKDFALLGYEK